MWHVGVDLHRKTVVIAAVHDTGEVRSPVRWEKWQTEEIDRTFQGVRGISCGRRSDRDLSLAVQIDSPLGSRASRASPASPRDGAATQ